MTFPTAGFFLILGVAFAYEKQEVVNLPSMSPTRMERVRQFLATLNAEAVAELPYVNDDRKQNVEKRVWEPHPPIIVLVNIEGTEVKLDQPMSITELNEEMAPYLYEGDILLTDQQIDSMEARMGEKGTRLKRTAPVDTANKWDAYKPIPYRLNGLPSQAARAAVKSATVLLARKTCLSFVENPSAGYGLDFFSGDGCFSAIGQLFGQANRPGWQKVSLGPGCESTNTGVHEIMHALGSDHTQTRFDRDSYVTIDTRYMLRGRENNFKKHTRKENTNVVPYDYGSVMHYESTAFAKDRSSQTIFPYDEQYTHTMSRNRVAVAFSDWKALSLMYNCTRSCQAPIVQCQNGGYVNPHYCDRCECPDFFSGTTCENVVNPVRVDNRKLFSYSKTHGDATLARTETEYENFEKSPPYLVVGPEGSRLRVTFSGYNSSLQDKTCKVQGAEVVDGDLTMVGRMYCCQEDVGLNFVSKSNKVGIKFYNHPGFVVSHNVTVQVV